MAWWKWALVALTSVVPATVAAWTIVRLIIHEIRVAMGKEKPWDDDYPLGL